MLRSQIVEAVDALRQRKCRPEREAIAHYVLRKWGVPFQEVFSELENIVDRGDLVKVEYKGSTSYRSLEAFDSKASPLLTKHSKILNSCKTSRFIITAVSELLGENESYTREGVPQEEIKSKLYSYEPSRFTPETTQIFLDREINVGTLVEGPGKRLFPKDIAIPEDRKSAPEKKMRGRKSNATKEKEAAQASSSTAPDPNVKVKEEVIAIKSAPPKTPEPAKTVRAYVRKQPSEKKLLVLVNHGEEEKEQEVAEENAEEIDVKPVVPKVEETTTGRSVRNKRKKEVFDPSDIVPKKRQSLTTTPAKEKASPQASKAKSPAVPATATTPTTAKKGRKKKVVEPEPVPGEPDVVQCEHCKRHKNIKGTVEEFLVCSDCNVNYHPSCLDYSKEQAARVMEKGTWQCAECKACQVCQDQCSEGPETILCTNCHTGFHFKCLKLSPKTARSTWLCPGCKDTEEETETENIQKELEEILEAETEKIEFDEPPPELEDESAVRAAELESQMETEAEPEAKDEPAAIPESKIKTEPEPEPEPEPEVPKKRAGRPPKKRIITLTLNNRQDSKKKKEPVLETPAVPSPAVKEEKEDDIPSDASKWTPSQVEAYFKKYGLQEEGLLFREQEVDGDALLQMKRSDIVQGMKFLLGPALKVYRLVFELQSTNLTAPNYSKQ